MAIPVYRCYHIAMIKQQIHLIKMGGTIEFIDSAYDAINREMLKLDTTIETYFNNIIKPHFDFTSDIVTDKDSRDIDVEDRERLASAISASECSDILVTHGTFTMRETAEFLDQKGFEGKKIILTGSMIPMVGFAASDAGFNLGFAIASFSSLEAGVYLSMNGGLFRSNEVTKNEDIFRFE